MSLLFVVLLVAVFWSWSRLDGTLSIHRDTTPRPELFDWAAVLATFAMGIALGDLAAYTLNLGFLSAWARTVADKVDSGVDDPSSPSAREPSASASVARGLS